MPKKNIALLIATTTIVLSAIFLFPLNPATQGVSQTQDFEIGEGEGFLSISHRLKDGGFIRSVYAFELLAFITGSADEFKPGVYAINPSRGSFDILKELVAGPHREVSVRIYEGASVYEIDKLLEGLSIIEKGKLVNLAAGKKLEGRLFPDTYRFFKKSGAEDIAKKFLENFSVKTAGMFEGYGEEDIKDILIMASLVEKEVPRHEDRKIVAGIIKKRLKVGMPLQVDATICYIKRIREYPELNGCHPLSRLDFGIDSAYNTYLYKGLPPGPIGNPGVSAISAVIDSSPSSYWFYLSDPETQATIFSGSLDEHNDNRAKYLGL